MKLVSIHTLMFFIFLLLGNIEKLNAQIWSLDQCIDTAQVYNRNLQIQRNGVLINLERQQEAKANLVPKITANADYKYFTDLPYQLLPLSVFGGPQGQFKEAQFGVPHNVNANLQLVVPLYNSQIYGAIETTNQAAELAQLNYVRSEEQVFFEISNLYYNAQLVEHQIIFLDSNIINAKKLLSNLELLNQQLMAKGTDVSKVKLQIAQLTTQLETAQNKYQQILNGLKFAMGIPLERNIAIDSEIQILDLVIETESKNIDVRFAHAQRNVMLSEFKTLKYSRMPSLNFLGSYGTTGFGYDEKPNDFFNFYPIGFVGIQFSYVLFNGGVTQQRMSQKKLELENNSLQIELLSGQNNMQITNANLQRNASQRTVITSQEQVDLALKIYNEVALQKNQGTASLTDLLLADNELRKAQQDYLSAVIDYLKADLELKKLTGNY
jgi:outer membrane protein TolC